MFVCLSVCLFVCKLFFSVKDFSATTWVRILKFGTRLDSDELYCVTKELYPRYEVYRGYIVFAFSVIMFVCLSVCLFVCKLFFSVKDFSATTWVRILKFGTRLDSDELYCVTKEQPHIAYQSLYLFIFLSLQWKNFSSKISQQLLGLGF